MWFYQRFMRNKIIQCSFCIKESAHRMKLVILSELYLFVYLQWSISMNALNMMIINCTHNICTYKYLPVIERILVSRVYWRIRLLLFVIMQSKISINIFIMGVLSAFSLKVQLGISSTFYFPNLNLFVWSKNNTSFAEWQKD